MVPQHSFNGVVEHAIAHIEEAFLHDVPEEQQRWYAIKILSLIHILIFERKDLLMIGSKFLNRVKAAAVSVSVIATALVSPFAVPQENVSAAVSVNYAKDVYKRQIIIFVVISKPFKRFTPVLSIEFIRIPYAYLMT